MQEQNATPQKFFRARLLFRRTGADAQTAPAGRAELRFMPGRHSRTRSGSREPSGDSATSPIVNRDIPPMFFEARQQ